MSITHQDVSLLPPQSDVVHPQRQIPCGCGCKPGQCAGDLKHTPRWKGRLPYTPQGADPYRWRYLAFAAMVLLTIPGALYFSLGMDPGVPSSKWDDEAIRVGVPAAALSRGEKVYARTCVACHGPQGDGIPRLGKPLRNSAFVQGATDEELIDLIVRGRAVTDPLNTTHTPMPPRAGFDTLTRLDIRDVVSYLRAIQQPGAPFAATDAWIVPLEELKAAATGGVGHEAFITSCSACHGKQGEGVEGSGVPLRGSDFVKGLSESELVAFVKRGRQSWDPDSKTGIDMPPKGGNPALSDATLADIITYIKSIQDNQGS